MMYYLNKIFFALVNPLCASLILMAVAFVLVATARGVLRRALGLGALVVAFVLLLAFSLPVSTMVAGLPLEREFPQQDVMAAPEADAIVVLGGGTKANTNLLFAADMDFAADRVWHAARLYRAGKAPVVILSGIGERYSALPLVKDLGVSEDAVIIDDESRNTEENAAFTERIIKERFGVDRPVKVLLVTSAWHMRRSLFMFRKYAPSIEVIPSACDYEAHQALVGIEETGGIIPSTGALDRNTAFLKEHLGYWGYKLLRK